MGELLRDELLEHCDAPGCANGVIIGKGGVFVAYCSACRGSTRRRRGPHDPRSAIDYEPTSPESLHVAQYATPPETHVARLVPVRLLQRLGELAAVVRDPTNSTQFAELLDVAQEVARG
jgi:hypothetical protein